MESWVLSLNSSLRVLHQVCDLSTVIYISFNFGTCECMMRTVDDDLSLFSKALHERHDKMTFFHYLSESLLRLCLSCINNHYMKMIQRDLFPWHPTLLFLLFRSQSLSREKGVNLFVKQLKTMILINGLCMFSSHDFLFLFFQKSERNFHWLNMSNLLYYFVM